MENRRDNDSPTSRVIWGSKTVATTLPGKPDRIRSLTAE